jgi:soluble lytic murein transglycosylase
MRAFLMRGSSAALHATPRLMSRTVHRWLCAVLAVLGLTFHTGVGYAQSDDDFMAAREAFRTGNRARLDTYASRLGDHVLYPYVAYWQMRGRLDEITPGDVRALINRLSDGPLADRLRNDWLRSLGKRAAWDELQAEVGTLRNPDPDVACYELQRRMALGDADALRQARALWLGARQSADTCTSVFERAIQAGVIRADDVWARIRTLLEQNQVSLAKAVTRYLTAMEGFDPKLLDAAAANPRLYLERLGAAPLARGQAEIAVFALQRLARASPQDALTRLRALLPVLAAADRDYLWGQLGYHGAMVHDPDALGWFARATRLTEVQLAWRTRAALRAKLWSEVLAAIDMMAEPQKHEPEWRYWRARALKVQGKVVEANALLAPLSTEHHFYGLLAGEELGETFGLPAESYRPSAADIQAVATVPAIRRALALYRLGLRFEGNREWFWAIQSMDDRQLIATAEFARRNELWDRAINTAERTRSVHDFGLRYLAPYRERFRAYAAEHGLDEAWVFGIARQESRFIADARSSAGAMGLMQLMPGTAKWVAGKLGMKTFRQAAVTDLDTNISMGTYYLRHVLDTLDNQPVLASAGYNAGPGRARAWRAAEDMEGAIYSETIPFNETRDYVKKVMANATYYSQVFGQRLVGLRERLGLIPRQSRAQ